MRVYEVQWMDYGMLHFVYISALCVAWITQRHGHRKIYTSFGVIADVQQTKYRPLVCGEQC